MSIIDSDDESEEDIKKYFKKSTSSKKSKGSHKSKDKKKKIKKDKDKKSKKSKKDKSDKYGYNNWYCFVNRNGWIFYLISSLDWGKNVIRIIPDFVRLSLLILQRVLPCKPKTIPLSFGIAFLFLKSHLRSPEWTQNDSS